MIWEGSSVDHVLGKTHSRNALFVNLVQLHTTKWMINNWKNLKRVEGRLHRDKKDEFAAMFKAAGIRYWSS